MLVRCLYTAACPVNRPALLSLLRSSVVRRIGNVLIS